MLGNDRPAELAEHVWLAYVMLSGVICTSDLLTRYLIEHGRLPESRKKLRALHSCQLLTLNARAFLTLLSTALHKSLIACCCADSAQESPPEIHHREHR